MRFGQGVRSNTVTEVPIQREDIDFTDTLAQSWSGTTKSPCSSQLEPAAMSLVPGFTAYSGENCKLSRMQVSV
jgi:hypothetical protein